ncbi:MAG: hypothetical protein IJ422_06265 [Oscillospiraceae bacterium]|nr:hypothetical protein [Oscillospiraceae bacterium]
MIEPYSFCIRVCGIRIRFHVPSPVEMAEEFIPFLCDSDEADEEFRIQLITKPLPLDKPPAFRSGYIKIYQTDEGWLRVYPPLIEADGCQVACLLRPNGENVLFYPAKKWGFYASPLRCAHLIGAETLLLRHDALLLHSSVVCHEGKAILFSGPSGAGKSTQAGLWARYLGADILNGDRCVIRKELEGFIGSGCPWAGTSGIFRQSQAPISGIFLVTQSPQNSVERLGVQAFSPLYSQTLVNSWDPAFMEKILPLLEKILEQVPVYRLNCRADREAVELAYQSLF